MLVAILASPVVCAQVVFTKVNDPYRQSFDSLAATGASNDMSTLPKGWMFLETGANADNAYAAGTGSATTGNTYSFGTDAADRAFGTLQSGPLVSTLGASFINHTGMNITSLDVTYWGEQWRLGAAGRGPDRLIFQYSLDAASLNSGTWTSVESLDVVSPATAGPRGALNGNDPVHRVLITGSITELTIKPGDTIYFRWLDFNVSNSDDGLAIDDFELTARGTSVSLPSIVFSPEEMVFGSLNIHTSDTLSYRVSGSNLTDSITVTSDLPAISISLDGLTFQRSIKLPQDGGDVFVRFAPSVNGIVTDSIAHQSGTTVSYIKIIGSGFDPAANIIPISAARTYPVGAVVTISGRVTAAKEFGNPVYVQDDSGGIAVFHSALVTAVETGDSVIVTGPIGRFNDQVQISGADISFNKIEVSKRLVVPKPIAIGELTAYEGWLVTLQDVELVNKNFVFYPQSTEQIAFADQHADLRIDGDTDIPGLQKPRGAVDITGVVGRFKENVQLLPRSQHDIPGIVAYTTPYDDILKDETLDIVNWNLEFFGARRDDYDNVEFGPADESLQLTNVKTVLDSLNADIIAVQEISNDSLFAELVEQLRGHYAFVCSERYSYSYEPPDNKFPPQKTCFIYNTATIEVVSARAMFESLYDSARTTNPSLLPGYPGEGAADFYSHGRLPFLLTVKATINGVTETISCVNIHGKSGSTASDYNRRLYDAQVLKDTLDAHFTGRLLTVLGDFNDDLDKSIVKDLPSPYASFVADSSGFVPVTKSLSDLSLRSTVNFTDVVDHQVISREFGKCLLEGSETIVAPFAQVREYGTTTSDHLPVITRYELFPEISFAVDSSTLREETGIHSIELQVRGTVNDTTLVLLKPGGNAVYGDDYVTIPEVTDGVLTLTLLPGASTASFVIHVLDDTLDELPEALTIALEPSGKIRPGETSVVTSIILDNDVPTVFFAQSFAVVDEGDDDLSIELNISTPPATDQFFTVRIKEGSDAKYGSDYVTVPEADNGFVRLMIPAGSTGVSLYIRPLTNSRREQPLEGVTFHLSEASAGLSIGVRQVFSLSIKDVRRRATDFKLFPTPTDGDIHIVNDEWNATEECDVELRDEQGRVLYVGTGTLEAVTDSLNERIRRCRKGIYFVVIVVYDRPVVVRLLKN